MKKIITIAALAATLATSSALAKTEGNYVGIDVLRASASNKDKPSDQFTKALKDHGVGVGVNYKYAFNFNNAFLAPGVFFDQLGLKTKSIDDTYSYSNSVNYRYGTKLDLGYDITDNFSAYLTNGVANVKYEFKDAYNNGSDIVTSKKSGSKLGYFYGAGLSYKINKEFAVNLEYNAQRVNLKTSDSALKTASDIRVAKVGLSYNF